MRRQLIGQRGIQARPERDDRRDTAGDEATEEEIERRRPRCRQPCLQAFWMSGGSRILSVSAGVSIELTSALSI